MKSIIATAAAAVVLSATSALAWEGKVVACYDKVWVQPDAVCHKKPHKPAKTVWEHRGDQLVEVYYAPVYKEICSQKPGYWLKRKAACRTD